MAAASAQRTNRPCKVLAFTVLLIASLLNAGVTAQESDATTAPVVPKQTEAPGGQDSQFLIYPSPNDSEITAQTTAEPTTAKSTEEAVDNNDSHPAAAENTPDNKELTVEAHTDIPITMESETPAPMPARGDGPRNIPQEPPVSQEPPVPQEPQVSQEPQPVPKDDVVCVSKEAVQDKNAVSLKLKASSSCKDTRVKIESVLQELCAEDCKLDIYQEDNTDEIIVSGKYVEDDVAGMTEKFNNDNIKDKTDVESAVPRWGKNSKLVLVSLLLTGLLLAALLVAGYYLKTHRKNSKGVRLAESFQVDEENQANTLVSVAPLPQEPLDKPAVNGESPPENGTNAAPTTNGHSATQTPVADTEM